MSHSYQMNDVVGQFHSCTPATLRIYARPCRVAHEFMILQGGFSCIKSDKMLLAIIRVTIQVTKNSNATPAPALLSPSLLSSLSILSCSTQRSSSSPREDRRRGEEYVVSRSNIDRRPSWQARLPASISLYLLYERSCRLQHRGKEGR